MLVAIGRISGTHGLRGDVKVESFSQEYSHFAALDRVLLRPGGAAGQANGEGGYREREVTVLGWKKSGGKAVLSLDGVDSAEKAARLCGMELWVPREYAAPLGEDEYYVTDLIGMSLRWGEEAIGRVAAVCEGGQSQLLEVDLGDRNVLVPLLDVYIGSVDLE